MIELIPHLKDLRDVDEFEIDTDFVWQFVQTHAGDWRLAQSHWELVVEMVLDTDAVEQRATGKTAIRQAVRASHKLLLPMVAKNRCPICVNRKEP